jgi:Tfp pilus assembly ATPase PilU
LLPDDAVRNLIRQGKVEQIYSVMQTGTAKGMQTMEQSLAELILRGIVLKDVAMSRSSRPDQLAGLLERAGFGDADASADGAEANGHAEPAAQEPVFGGLRVAD